MQVARIAFAGTPEFARAALVALAQAGWSASLVLTQPDRPSGRGLRPQASPVKQWALQAGAQVLQPRGLRLDAKHADDAATARDALIAFAPDVLVVAAYGLILPAWVLALPRLGCLNIHASLLPRWRGAAPIHRAIEAGDAHTGITLMQMDEGLDTGDMLLAQAIPIDPQDTTASLHDRLADLGGRLAVQALEAAFAGGLRPVAQPTQGITYAHKIAKSEGPIDWAQPATVIERRIRAFDPFPGASFELAGETVKLWRAAVQAGVAGAEPGSVLRMDSDGLTIACGDGALDVLVVQSAGGKRQAVADWLRGHPPSPAAQAGRVICR